MCVYICMCGVCVCVWCVHVRTCKNVDMYSSPIDIRSVVLILSHLLDVDAIKSVEREFKDGK